MPAVNTIQLRRDTAANWTSVNPTLAVGELGFETNTRLIKAGNGANNWSTLPYLGLTPAGVISQFAGSAAPSGYLLCEGQSVSTTTFADLFAVIGYTYGGSGANFTVPNLKGRIPVGRDSAQTEFDVLGEASGEKAVTLTIGQIPPHSHRTQPFNTSGSVAYAATNLFISDGVNTEGNGGETTTIGGGGAHNNLQPYIVVNYIIKT